MFSQEADQNRYQRSDSIAADLMPFPRINDYNPTTTATKIVLMKTLLGMKPSKFNQTRWEWHRIYFQIIPTSCAILPTAPTTGIRLQRIVLLQIRAFPFMQLQLFDFSLSKLCNWMTFHLRCSSTRQLLWLCSLLGAPRFMHISWPGRLGRRYPGLR